MFVAVCAAAVTLPALVEVNIGTPEAPLIVPVAFYAVTSIAVMGLYLAFAIPIWLRWKHGDRFEVGAWNNGSKYKWMNLVAVAEIVIVIFYLSMPFVPAGNPFSDDFAWKFVNYAPLRDPGVAAAPGGLVEGLGEEVVHRARRTPSTRRWSRRSTTDPDRSRHAKNPRSSTWGSSSVCARGVGSARAAVGDRANLRIIWRPWVLSRASS